MAQIEPCEDKLCAVYSSMMVAEKITGISHKQISFAVCGQHLSSGGYRWADLTLYLTPYQIEKIFYSKDTVGLLTRLDLKALYESLPLKKRRKQQRREIIPPFFLCRREVILLTKRNEAVKLPSNGGGLTSAALDELAKRLAPLVTMNLVNCIDVENTPFQKGDGSTMKITALLQSTEKSGGFVQTRSRNTQKSSCSYAAV